MIYREKEKEKNTDDSEHTDYFSESRKPERERELGGQNGSEEKRERLERDKIFFADFFFSLDS